MAHKNTDVDVFFLEYCPSWLFRLVFRIFRPTAKLDKDVKDTEMFYKGIKYNIIRIPKLIIDYLISVKLHLPSTVSKFIERYNVSRFKNYDIIVAHSTTGAHLAKLVQKKYGIPYIAVWHGSDINYTPLESKYKFNEVKSYVSNAACNVYVSNALKNTSESLFGLHENCVIYNGVEDIFRPIENKVRIRKKNNCDERTVIAFVGGLLAVKNVEVLPRVFNEINSKQKNCIFWIIGEGKFRSQLHSELENLKVDYKFWGNVEQEQMVELYNCIDLLVLPSKNEGLPLVILEAIACECNVVASDVGGISEVLSSENIVPLDDCFVKNFSQRCIKILTHNNSTRLHLSKDFLWSTISKQEYELLQRVLDSIK